MRIRQLNQRVRHTPGSAIPRRCDSSKLLCVALRRDSMLNVDMEFGYLPSLSFTYILR